MAAERVTRQALGVLATEPSAERVTRVTVEILSGPIPVLHWDASTLALADGTHITSWADEIGGIPATGPVGPTFEVGDSPMGNLPGVRFTDLEYLTSTTGPSMSVITVCMVVRMPPGDADRHYIVPQSNGHLLMAEWEGTAGRWILGRSQFTFIEFTDATLLDTFGLWTWQQNGAASQVRVNQVQRATGNAGGPDTSSVIGFGADTGGQSDFTVNEILIFDEALVASEIDVIEDYLYNKWFVNPPDAPTAVDATAQSTTEILVEWTDVADETGYRVERSDDGTTGWTPISGDLAAGTESYLDDGLDPDTEYFYRVIAFNLGGDGDASAVVSDSTFPEIAPDTPTGFTATPTRVGLTVWEVVLEWDDVAVESGYRIENQATPVDDWIEVDTVAANVLTYTVEGLASNYDAGSYRVIALNFIGESAPTDPVPVVTDEPGVGVILTGLSVSPTNVDLTWTAQTPPTDDPYFYEVWTSEDGVIYTPVDTVPSGTLVYEVTGLTTDLFYWFKVFTVDASGSVESNVMGLFVGLSEPTSRNETYGVPRYGTGGGRTAEDIRLPTVEVTGPVSPVGAVPYVVTWDYFHEEGVPQSEWRVEIFYEDVLLYSSGWQLGLESSHQIPIHLGLADHVGAVIRVTVAGQNRGYQASDQLLLDTLFGVPTVTWVYPDPTDPRILEPLIVAEWEYEDTQGKPQAFYRVNLEYNSDVVYDSGWIPGPAVTHEIPYLLSGGSRYRVGVIVRNSNLVESAP